ncbi:MAG: hypothetical protein MUO82_06805 [Candidatus Thermoplasmatota archaeon]|nr:hypothetical protein [Candidatus Thermoplasmatota archaeon]
MNRSYNSNTKEIFSVMGKLKENFNLCIRGNIKENKLEENVETDNFRGRFYQFVPSGGKLNIGDNFIDENGIATVTQDIKFQISVIPKNSDNAPPLRLGVDNSHRQGTNKIIHINSSDGQRFDVPYKDIEELMPGNCIDLVRISGSVYFQNAINKSLKHWKI